ncbi:hypothetical protein LTR08_006189 [Meristemomyces frigidus]|nr:hypothetical protein LTR08_006189 [Meristemomyces frigidus]
MFNAADGPVRMLFAITPVRPARTIVVLGLPWQLTEGRFEVVAAFVVEADRVVVELELEEVDDVANAVRLSPSKKMVTISLKRTILMAPVEAVEMLREISFVGQLCTWWVGS